MALEFRRVVALGVGARGKWEELQDAGVLLYILYRGANYTGKFSLGIFYKHHTYNLHTCTSIKFYLAHLGATIEEGNTFLYGLLWCFCDECTV